jgi:hypothetical protein
VPTLAKFIERTEHCCARGETNIPPIATGAVPMMRGALLEVPAADRAIRDALPSKLNYLSHR